DGALLDGDLSDLVGNAGPTTRTVRGDLDRQDLRGDQAVDLSGDGALESGHGLVGDTRTTVEVLPHLVLDLLVQRAQPTQQHRALRGQTLKLRVRGRRQVGRLAELHLHTQAGGQGAAREGVGE